MMTWIGLLLNKQPRGNTEGLAAGEEKYIRAKFKCYSKNVFWRSTSAFLFVRSVVGAMTYSAERENWTHVHRNFFACFSSYLPIKQHVLFIVFVRCYPENCVEVATQMFLTEFCNGGHEQTRRWRPTTYFFSYSRNQNICKSSLASVLPHTEHRIKICRSPVLQHSPIVSRSRERSTSTSGYVTSQPSSEHQSPSISL